VVCLLEHGADPDARSIDGRRPLDVIPTEGASPEVMEILTLHTAPD
jgi:hypothetical protein